MIRNFAAFVIRNFAVVCGGITMLVGAGFFVGLAGGIWGGNPVGSVCFIFLGAGLICYGRRIPRLRPPGRWMAASVVVVAVLSGVQSSIHLWATEGDVHFLEKWPAL